MATKEGTKNRAPILTYHSIDNSGSIISTSYEKFIRQMNYLTDSSFRVISLEEITTCILENRPFPSKSVAITFDDGYKNVYDIAYPVLKEKGFGATVFVIPEYCCGYDQWNRQGKRIPQLELLNSNEISEMARNGIDFGAHTMSHPDLSKLPLDKAAAEILTSKAAIKNYSGKEVQFFAYPFGRQTKEISKIVKKEFYGACSTELGFATLRSDIYSLPRIDMYYFSRNNFFTWIETSLFSHYIRLRNMLRILKGT